LNAYQYLVISQHKAERLTELVDYV